MTSIAGDEPSTLTSQQIVDAWDQGLRGLGAIHHQVGNYEVTITGNEADAFCYGIALHYLKNPTNKNTRTFKNLQCSQVNFVELIIREYVKPESSAVPFAGF